MLTFPDLGSKIKLAENRPRSRWTSVEQNTVPANREHVNRFLGLDTTTITSSGNRDSSSAFVFTHVTAVIPSNRIHRPLTLLSSPRNVVVLLL